MKYHNLVFEGGGVLGIAYLGVLDFLSQQGIYQGAKRVAGTSAGAITACITSFNLPFKEIKQVADSLDYRKVPEASTHPNLRILSESSKKEIESIFGDINCVYRILNHYGWYSSNYFYRWIQQQIANQFDQKQKRPPYTFADFRNPRIHKNKRAFKDLYIIGTNISYKDSMMFSYETTPNMEVAEAVRISMSIPLFFESIKVKNPSITKDSKVNIFSDGGVMRNYPINIFDSLEFKDEMKDGVNVQTLGARFLSKTKYSEINNLLDYIKNLNIAFTRIQQDMYNHSPQDKERSIEIDTKDVSSVDFNITPNDATYNFLYSQGYHATLNYFRKQ